MTNFLLIITSISKSGCGERKKKTLQQDKSHFTLTMHYWSLTQDTFYILLKLHRVIHDTHIASPVSPSSLLVVSHRRKTEFILWVVFLLEFLCLPRWREEERLPSVDHSYQARVDLESPEYSHLSEQLSVYVHCFCWKILHKIEFCSIVQDILLWWEVVGLSWNLQKRMRTALCWFRWCQSAMDPYQHRWRMIRAELLPLRQHVPNKIPQ